MIDLFPKPPRKRPRVLMHVIDAGHQGGKPIVKLECKKCSYVSGWLQVDTVTEAKRGLPCPEAKCAREACRPPGLFTGGTPKGTLRRLRTMKRTHSSMSADELKAWRVRHGLTKEQAAARLGVSERMIYRYSDRERPLPISQTVKLLADAVDDLKAMQEEIEWLRKQITFMPRRDIVPATSQAR